MTKTDEIIDTLNERLATKQEQLTRARENLGVLDDLESELLIDAEIEGLEVEIKQLEAHIQTMKEENS